MVSIICACFTSNIVLLIFHSRCIVFLKKKGVFGWYTRALLEIVYESCC